MLFGRLAAVEIHPDNSVETTEPFRIEGLRIAFTLKRDLKKTSNTGTVEIYNLSNATRSKILDHNRKVVLYAGYEDGGGVDVLFEGSIMTVSHSHPTPDIVTRIEANDGETRLRQAHVSLSFSEGASVGQVLKDLIAAMGLPKGFIAQFKDAKFLTGFVAHGPAKEALAAVCRKAGLEYSIQNGSLQILEEGKPDNSPKDLILLTPESGLLGSPEKIKQIQDDPAAEKKPNGWTLRSLLQPKANPGSHIAVQSREIPRVTAFRIESVVHKGDTHGEDWTSEIEVFDPGVPL